MKPLYTCTTCLGGRHIRCKGDCACTICAHAIPKLKPVRRKAAKHRPYVPRAPKTRSSLPPDTLRIIGVLLDAGLPASTVAAKVNLRCRYVETVVRDRQRVAA